MAQPCPSERSAYECCNDTSKKQCWPILAFIVGLDFSAEDHFLSFNFVMSYMCKFNDRTKEIKLESFLSNPDRFYFTNLLNGGRFNRQSPLLY